MSRLNQMKTPTNGMNSNLLTNMGSGANNTKEKIFHLDNKNGDDISKNNDLSNIITGKTMFGEMRNNQNKNINCINGIYFDENDLLIADTIPINTILLRLIIKAIEGYSTQLFFYNIRRDRFINAIFKGRPPLSSYEQSYPSIKKVNIQYLPMLI